MHDIYIMQLTLYVEFYENEHGAKPRRVGISQVAWECLGQPDIVAGVRVYPRRGLSGNEIQPMVVNQP